VNVDRDAFATSRWARSDRPGGLPEPLAFTLLVLATYANEHGACWPPIGDLAHDLECSERTVKRRLADLRDRGLVSSQRRPNRSSLHRLAVPWCAGRDTQDGPTGGDAQADPTDDAGRDTQDVPTDSPTGGDTHDVPTGGDTYAHARNERQENTREHQTPQPPASGGQRKPHLERMERIPARSPAETPRPRRKRSAPSTPRTSTARHPTNSRPGSASRTSCAAPSATPPGTSGWSR
jgi:hypothetical protein